MFRGEAAPQLWAGNIGDTQIFTGVGLVKPKMQALQPGQDPVPSSYTFEQWEATLQQYADSIDTPMPTSMVAIANLFLRNAQQLGLSAGQAVNRIARNRLYNAGLSGWTVADGAQAAVTTLRVKRINGFTRARRPGLSGASQVRFDLVSASNPLPITIFDNAGPAEVSRTVVGFTPDTSGDETGPGTLTISGGAVTVSDRAYVFSVDRTFLARVGGGNKVDDIGSLDILKLADIRNAVAHLRQQNVPAMPSGRFHCHFAPASENQVFADPEWQRLHTSLPDYYMYKDFVVGDVLGCVFFRNSENPQADTVEGGLTATYSQEDPFAGELYNTGASTGLKIQRPIFVGQGAILEYYSDLSMLLTEAGITGKVGEPKINNNGIEVFTDRIQLILRAPQNRLQDLVSTSWRFIGDWPIRTDAAVGDAARYKRMAIIEHADS